jgi:hypothetical protein
MRLFLIVMFQLLASALFAQGDSVLYTRDLKLKEGIYKSFSDFRNNTPIPKGSITNTTRGINAPDFYVQLFNKNTVTYKDSSGAEQKLELKDIWGYCQEQSIFIGSREAVRLPVIGSISHFTRVETVYGPDMSGGVAGPVYTPPRQEINQYMLDMKTGNILLFSLGNFETMLENYDADLFKEFSALKKRKKKDMKFVYLRKYNEKHPLYFPVR